MNKEEVSFDNMLNALVGKYVISTKDDTAQPVDDIGLIKVIKYEHITDMAGVLLTYKRIAGPCYLDKTLIPMSSFQTENGINTVVGFSHIKLLYGNLSLSRSKELNND